MKRRLQGRYVTISTTGEQARAFIPADLPPIPPIHWTADLTDRFDHALLNLGRLDSVSTLLPDASLFLYTYVRKEAVLSSMIEGTQSSLADLLLYELEQSPGVPVDDVEEVSCYVAALNHGLRLLHQGIPLSIRLIREIHGKLLASGRGSTKTPGEFRKTQNWIGGTRPGNAVFVPPPPEAIAETMAALEAFLNDVPSRTPVLVKAALTHLQFETIHPFLDGNGRVGRLLITLLLCEQKVLRAPLLYLSLYFKTHRRRYYELLDTVRSTGDWEAWLEFFADAVTVTAAQAVDTAQTLNAVTTEHQAQLFTLGRATPSAMTVFQVLKEQPIVTAGGLVHRTGLTPATVNKSLAHLEHLGIVQEITAQRRNRVFRYGAYLDILNRGTELPT